MKIYVGHSSSNDYEEELYEPLKQSDLSDKHDLVFPHEGDEFFDSKDFLREECDLFLAEVSKASTGLGIELGWADLFDVPIVCVHGQGSNPSGSIRAFCGNIRDYSDKEELIRIIRDFVEELENE
ncbi:MAG: hypothetical protein ABEJ56_07075 [Candidatus Nanohaloarchaea archaeon]